MSKDKTLEKLLGLAGVSSLIGLASFGSGAAQRYFKYYRDNPFATNAPDDAAAIVVDEVPYLNTIRKSVITPVGVSEKVSPVNINKNVERLADKEQAKNANDADNLIFPLAIPMIGGSILGGYALGREWASSNIKATMKNKLDEIKRNSDLEFERALAYEHTEKEKRRKKTGSYSELLSSIDNFFEAADRLDTAEQVVKRASTLGLLLGAVGTIGMAGGWYGYHKAYKERLAEIEEKNRQKMLGMGGDALNMITNLTERNIADDISLKADVTPFVSPLKKLMK